MEGERESPTSSPAPNQQQHPAPVEELGDEAEAFPTPAPLELPHTYRYLSPEPSPAPSHSGLEGDYDLIDSHPEASLSFTRQFDKGGGRRGSPDVQLDQVEGEFRKSGQMEEKRKESRFWTKKQKFEPDQKWQKQDQKTSAFSN